MQERKMRGPVLPLAVAVALLALAGCARQTIVQDPPGGPIPPPQLLAGVAQPGTAAPPPTNALEGLALPAAQADLVLKSGSDAVYFANDGFALDSAARATLAAQARWLNLNPAVRARIEGHADERGTRDYYLALGERRANAVRSFLISQGVSPARLAVVSWGKERPASEGSNQATWALNRRAVTVIVQ